MLSDIKLWTPPKITVGKLNDWMKLNRISHRQVAQALGMSMAGLRNLLYSAETPETELAPRICCALAATAIFSGMSGLIDDVKLVDINVAIHLAKGVKASHLPKKERTLADVNALGYASRLADVLLRTAINKVSLPNEQTPGTDASGKAGTNAAPPSTAVS